MKKKTWRSKAEIKKQISIIKKEFEKLPHFNMFGDDNWQKRDDIIETLESALRGDIDEFDADDFMNDIVEEVGDEASMENGKKRTIDWLQCYTEDI